MGAPSRNKLSLVAAAVLISIAAVVCGVFSAFASFPADYPRGDLSITKDTNIDTDQEFEFEIQFFNDDGPVDGPYEIKKETPKQYIFAVYSEDDKTFNFYQRSIIPEEGTVWDDSREGYVGKSRTATRVYTGFDTEIYDLQHNPPWVNEVTLFETSKVVDVVSPESTTCWYQSCANLKSVDVSNLDTSKVKSMAYMFYSCKKLTDLVGMSKLNTSNVTSMNSIFCDCELLPATALKEVEGWDVSRVRDFYQMFANCFKNAATGGVSQALDLSNWNVDSPTNMAKMFFHCEALGSIGNISKWETGSVTDMSEMFVECSKMTSLDGISEWDVGNVTSMRFMFGACSALAGLDLSKWSTASLRDASNMFIWCPALKSVGDVSRWDTGHVVDASNMFKGCYVLTGLGDLAEWDLGACENTSAMFWKCLAIKDLGDLTQWDVGNVKDMSHMFFATGIENIDVSGWDVGKVDNMDFMFSTYEYSDLDATWIPQNPNCLKSVNVSGWNVKQGIAMADMFSGNFDLSRIYVSIGADWSRNSCHHMFNGCSNLAGDSGTLFTWEYINGEMAKDDAEGNPGYFWGIEDATYNLAPNVPAAAIPSGVTKIVYTDAKAPSGVAVSKAFAKDPSVDNVFSWVDPDDPQVLYVSTQQKKRKPVAPATGFSPIGVSSARGNIVEADVSFIDVSNVKSFAGAFSGAGSLQVVDMSGWDVGKATTTAGMFENDSSLKTVYASPDIAWTSLVDSNNMFSGCTLLVGGLGTGLSETDASFARVDGTSGTDGYFTPPITVSYCDPETSKMSAPVRYEHGMVAAAIDSPYIGWSIDSDMSTAELAAGEAIAYDPENIHDIKLFPAGVFEDPDGTTFAVYSVDDHSLRFYKRGEEDIPSPGEFFYGKVATFVATGIEDESYTSMTCPWSSYAASIEQVAVMDRYIQPTSTAYWFSYLSYCTDFDLSKLDTSKVTDMTQMFSECHAVTHLDLSSWDTSSLANTTGMFFLCRSLATLDLGNGEDGWNTGKLVVADNMFSNCYSLAMPAAVPGWRTSSLTSAAGMFANCNSFESVDFRGWDTSSLSNASYMFYWCRDGLKSVDLSGWDVRSLSTTCGMFAECANLSEVSLFANEPKRLTDTSRMFSGCERLSSLDTTRWTWSAGNPISDATSMFRGCESLTECSAAAWDWSSTEQTYAIGENCPAFSSSLSARVLSNGEDQISTSQEFSLFSLLGLEHGEEEADEHAVEAFSAPTGLQSMEEGTADAGDASVSEPDRPFVEYSTLEIVDNKVRIKLRNGEKLTIIGLPENTTYIVTEIPAKGWTEQTENPKSGSIEAGGEQKAPFFNTKENAVKVGIAGIVLLDGKLAGPGTNVGNDFVYNLANEETGEVLATASSDGNGVVSFPDAIAGEGRYIVYRDEKNDRRDKIAYDDHMALAIVTAATGETGEMEVKIESNGSGAGAGGQYVLGSILFEHVKLKELPDTGFAGLVALLLIGASMAAAGQCMRRKHRNVRKEQEEDDA